MGEAGIGRNVRYFQRHGFQVVVEEVEPKSQIRFWTMRRDPGARV
jgi:hypothetical protein